MKNGLMSFETRLPKKFAQLPDGEIVVSMCVHKGSLVVASNRNVYWLSEAGKLERIPFEIEEEK